MDYLNTYRFLLFFTDKRELLVHAGQRLLPTQATPLETTHSKMNGGGPPVIVMNTNMERQSGHKAQLSNIQAAKVMTLRVCRSRLLALYKEMKKQAA